jgi:hypothetical protein
MVAHQARNECARMKNSNYEFWRRETPEIGFES